MSNGNKGTIIEALKALLSSPVGGWALAVIAIAIMAYMSFKDRQAIYADLLHLRADAMPLIHENNRLAQEILDILKKEPHGQ